MKNSPLTICLGLLFTMCSVLANAQEQPSSDNSKGAVAKEADTSERKRENSKAQLKRQPSLSDEKVLEFAKGHVPGLVRLVISLREREPEMYEKAIADLARSVERLKRIENRTPDRYEHEIKLWKMNSTISLVAVKYFATGESNYEAELVKLLRRRSQLEIERLKHEQQILRDRLKKLEAAIARKQETEDEQVEKELERLRRRYTDVSQNRPRKPVKKSSKDVEN